MFMIGILCLIKLSTTNFIILGLMKKIPHDLMIKFLLEGERALSRISDKVVNNGMLTVVPNCKNIED